MAAQSKNNPSTPLVDADTRKQVNQAADSVRDAVNDVGNAVSEKTQSVFNSVVPQEQRDAFVNRVQDFQQNRPKLSAFVGINLLLSGIPLALFTIFSVSVFFFSLITTMSIALFTTATFTAVSVGTALLILLPTLFFTTITATVLFVWGLTTFYILQWIQARRQGQISPTEQNIREKLNRIGGSIKNEASDIEDRFSKAWSGSGSSGIDGANYTTSRYGLTDDKTPASYPRGTIGADNRATVVVPTATVPGKTGGAVVVST